MPHDHPLDPDRVREARTAVMPRGQAERASTRLAALSDPTRLRLLQALDRVGELCVGDVALALEISEDASSYALRQLRAAGLVEARRDGRAVFYSLPEGFPRALLSHCVSPLGAAETGEADAS